MSTAPEETTLTPETWAAAFAAVAAHITDEAVAVSSMLYRTWLAADLTTPELTDLLADHLVVSIGGAMLSADAMTAVLTQEPTIGYTVDDATVTRLHKASRTLTGRLDEAGDGQARIERIAVSEPVNALQQTSVSAFAAHGLTGYQRGLDADPCELCTWLYKDGHVYPTSQPMHRHTGCQCVPVPVT